MTSSPRTQSSGLRKAISFPPMVRFTWTMRASQSCPSDEKLVFLDTNLQGSVSSLEIMLMPCHLFFEAYKK